MKGTSLGTRRKKFLRINGVVPVALGAMAVLASGCAEKRAHAIPWATAVQVRPVWRATTASQTSEAADLAPDLRMDLPPPPSQLAGHRPNPTRPRVPTTNIEDVGERTPQLAPQLSPQQLTITQQQTNESLNIAEYNLQLARGHKLNALQADLVSKISGFVAEARKAAAENNWMQAQNLAKKAQVLSEELAGQL
jgi:hypothetical protein